MINMRELPADRPLRDHLCHEVFRVCATAEALVMPWNLFFRLLDSDEMFQITATVTFPCMMVAIVFAVVPLFASVIDRFRR